MEEGREDGRALFIINRLNFPFKLVLIAYQAISQISPYQYYLFLPSGFVAVHKYFYSSKNRFKTKHFKSLFFSFFKFQGL